MTTGSQSRPVQAHTPLDWQDLIDSARRCLTPPSAATRADAHRAISTAYYAAYHALCESNAEMIVGQPTNQLAIDAWMRVYRGSSHRQATGNLERYRISLSANGEAFAITLGALYNARIRADYNPASKFNATAAQHRLSQAETAIQDFLALSTEERTAIATITLLRNR